MSVDLFVLYRQTDTGPQLSMGANSNRPGVTRAFTTRGGACVYARKHGARIARIHFPIDGPPAVVEVIDPKDPTA